MGIVRKQSLFSSILIYVGFIIGAINTMILLPKFFTPEELGLTRLYFDFASLFAPFLTLGGLATLMKFFPLYKSHLKPEENDLPTLVLGVFLFGCILFTAACLIFKELMERKFGHNSALFIKYYYYTIPFTLAFAAFAVMEGFCWVIHKTVISNFLREIPFRLVTTILIVLYIFKKISLDTFFALYSIIYFPSVVVALFILIKDGTIKLCFKISKVTRRLYKKILIFTSFHLSGVLIGVLPKTLDGIMIASINGLTEVGVYTLATNLIALMEVPQRAMLGISSALISEAWKDNNMVKLREIYQKSALTLLILGIGIFGLLYPNMSNLIRFEGTSYEKMKIIVLISGVAKILDMGMGMNQQILGFSKHWRVDFFTSSIFVVLSIPTNYIFIKHWGNVGAALGAGLLLTAFNFVRFVYNWRLFRLQPFSKKTFIALLIGIICILPTHYFPYLGNIYVDTIVRSGIFILLFGGSILYFNVSTDITDMYRMFVSKIKGGVKNNK